MSDGKATYTPKEAATIWGVSDQTVYRLIDSGEIKAEGRRVGMKRMRYTIQAEEVRRIRAMLDEEKQGNSYGLAVSA